MSTKPDLKCVAGTDVSGATSLSGVLARLEQQTMTELRSGVARLFDHADDLFFEFAGSARLDVERDRHLDAMRELRLVRGAIESRFFAAVARHFRNLPDPASSLNRDAWSPGSLQSLALVDHDELEQSVAAETMVSRARNAFQGPLHALAKRVDLVVDGVSVTEKNLPMDPRQLVDAFRESLSEFSAEIKCKLVVYKLFERHVLDGCGPLYDACNQMLARSGLLPELRDTGAAPRRTTPLSGESSAPRSAPLREVPAQASAIPVLSLMQALRDSRPARLEGEVDLTPIGSALPDAREVDAIDLMAMLNDLQRTLPMGQDALAGRLAMTPVDVRAGLESVFRQRAHRNGPERVSRQDSDVITLVGFLFDFILDDRHLPVRVKALLGRLQIPLLKVAVKDASFFGTHAHPARVLLNELAHAGLGLPDQDELLEHDGVFTRIKSTVQAVLDTFAEEAEVFSRLLEEFRTYMGSETRRAELLEQRTRSAEEGRALADQARQAVSQVLARKLEGRQLPVILVQCLQDAWSSVMFRAWVRDGETGQPWISALHTIDLLMQSVSPASDVATREALFNGLPVLQKRLRDGLESVSWNPLGVQHFIMELAIIQQQVIRGECPDYLASPIAEASEAEVVSSENAAAPAPAVCPPPASSPIRADLMAPLIRRAAVRHADAVIEMPNVPSLPEDDEHWVAARQMGVGTWVELIDVDGGKQRCKLAARIKFNDRMVFVSRAGVKVRDCSSLALAHELKACRVIVLDDSMLFDRALQSVIGNLRRVREAGAVSA